MECFRRAMVPEPTFEGRDMNLKHAERLTSNYARQLEALDKHRDKDKQKITVEHVNVHTGGQAIVGEVNASGEAADGSRDDRAEALPDENSTSESGEKLKKALEAKKAAPAKRKRQ